MTAGGRIWIFAGPSLPPAARPDDPALRWLPPAVAGDGLAALEGGAEAVVLIDGLFDQHPAIRHKELLALIEAGAPVIGGASMGALRAAELHACGMTGVGRIFEAYATGRLVGDDEVAVLHGPADMDWAPVTVPLVNVRATLMRAFREGVVGRHTAVRLRAAAAETFFQDRTWRLVVDEAEARGANSSALLAFKAWLASGYVDLKQHDAQACVAAALKPALRPAPIPSATPPTAFTNALAAQVRAGLKPQLASP